MNGFVGLDWRVMADDIVILVKYLWIFCFETPKALGGFPKY